MLNETPAWQDLAAHRKTLDGVHMRDLFTKDKKRAQNFSLAHKGLEIDFSRHRLTGDTLGLLLDFATSRDVETWRDRMFAGGAVNTSENRAVLHTALRAPAKTVIKAGRGNVMPGIHETLGQMKSFSDAVRNGSWRGYTNKEIRTVINIGIGGSDLGPRLVCDALKNYGGEIDMRFVANVDPADLDQALRGTEAAKTLFIIASKTFTTQETMANAAAARRWLLAALKDEAAVARHFVAVSTNEKEAVKFGIAEENIFAFGDWVGGRYSLWSAIGLPICIAAGFDNFRALLDGANAMDTHFRTAKPRENMPVILALLGLWYRNFWNAQSYAVLPYSHDLSLLPAWLQQLDMESNGKSVDRDGKNVTYDTGPAVFGQPGTNAQHAFFQLIHQGTSLIPCDFIAAREPSHPDERHKMLLANMQAQAQALMQGRTLSEAKNAPHRVFEGNRPSTIITVPRLDPFHLGQVLALYEHKIFVQGILWNINSFDQWGVELGKELAQAILGRKTPIS